MDKCGEECDDILECWISRGLSETSKKRAVEFLNETDERRPECLKRLRHQLDAYSASHPHVTFQRQDDRFLIQFLRARKYDVDKSMSLLKKSAKFRTKNVELFEDVTLDSIRPALEHKAIMILPERDQQGRRVIVYRMNAVNPDLSSPMDLQKAFVFIMNVLIEDEETQVNGYVVMTDYAGTSMSKLMRYDEEGLVAQMAQFLKEAYPVISYEYHVVNQPWYFNIAWSIAKEYMTAEMKDQASKPKFSLQ